MCVCPRKDSLPPPKQHHRNARNTKRTYYDTRQKAAADKETTGSLTLPFRRAAAPAAPLGRLAADADAACASLILAARATLKASASAASAAAEQSRHFLEASGLRAWVLVKLAAGSSCLHTLQESGSPLPSALLPPPPLLVLLDAALFVRGFGFRGAVRDGARPRMFRGKGFARWVMGFEKTNASVVQFQAVERDLFRWVWCLSLALLGQREGRP